MLTPPLLLWVLRSMASAWWVCVGCSDSPASWVLPGEEQGVMLIVSSSSLEDPLGVMFRCLLSCFYTLRWNLRYIWFCYLWCLFCMLDTISFPLLSLKHVQYCSRSIFLSLTVGNRTVVHSLRVASAKLVPHLLSSHTFIIWTTSCALHSLRPLSWHTRPVFLYTTSLC